MVKILDFQTSDTKDKVLDVIENTTKALEAALQDYFASNSNLAIGHQFAETDLIAMAFKAYQDQKVAENKKNQQPKVRRAVAIDHSPLMATAYQTYFVKYDSLKVIGDCDEDGIYTVKGTYETATSSIDYFKFHDERMFLKEPTAIGITNKCQQHNDKSPEISFKLMERLHIFGEADDLGCYVVERENGQRGLIDSEHLMRVAMPSGDYVKKDYRGAPNCNFISEEFINEWEAKEEKAEKKRQILRHNSEKAELLGAIKAAIQRIEKEANEERRMMTFKEVVKILVGDEVVVESEAESLDSFDSSSCSSSDDSDSGDSFEVVNNDQDNDEDKYEKQNAEILKRFSLEDCELESSHVVPEVDVEMTGDGKIVISTEKMSSWKFMDLHDAVEKTVNQKIAEWELEKKTIQALKKAQMTLKQLEDEDDSDSDSDDYLDDSDEESEEYSDVEDDVQKKKDSDKSMNKARIFFDDSEEDSEEDEESDLEVVDKEIQQIMEDAEKEDSVNSLNTTEDSEDDSDDNEEKKSDIEIITLDSLEEEKIQNKAAEEDKQQKIIDQYNFMKNMEALNAEFESMMKTTDVGAQREKTQSMREFMSSGWFNK